MGCACAAAPGASGWSAIIAEDGTPFISLITTPTAPIDASVRQIRVANDVFVPLSENWATKEAIFAENGEIRFESTAGSKPTDKLKLVPGELYPDRRGPAHGQ